MKTGRCSFAATCGRGCTDVRAAAAAAGRRALLRLEPGGEAAAALVRRPQRAPLVLLRGAPAHTVSLSLSHTAGAVAAAATSTGWRAGVDIERVGRVAAGEARYFLTARELPYLGSIDATTFWCLKEAAWKALECGSGVAFKSLELQFGAGARVIGVRLGRVRWCARARVRRLRARWVAAVVRVRDRPEQQCGALHGGAA
jgi:phosphopantetheinyl transferase (holo-ACP synthase)